MNRWKQFFESIWERRLEYLTGALVLVGLIFAFFYPHFGGALVGFGAGLCFYEEMHSYFIQLRDFFVDRGLFKSVLLVGIVLYLLITVPIFVIATAIGYGLMFVIRSFFQS